MRRSAKPKFICSLSEELDDLYFNSIKCREAKGSKASALLICVRIMQLIFTKVICSFVRSKNIALVTCILSNMHYCFSSVRDKKLFLVKIQFCIILSYSLYYLKVVKILLCILHSESIKRVLAQSICIWWELMCSVM